MIIIMAAKKPFDEELDLSEIEKDADSEIEKWSVAKSEKGTESRAFEGQEAYYKVVPNAVPGEHYVNFGLAPDEYLLQCPYENSHRILPMRMENHLYRCRKNYAKQLAKIDQQPRIIACHWNPCHLVSEIELQYHTAQCADRLKPKEAAKDHLKYAPKLKEYKELDQIDEDWSNDPPRFLAYDPKKKLEEEPILYQPKMMSKAEKKEYREEQRHKFYRQVHGPFWESFSNPRLDEFYRQELEAKSNIPVIFEQSEEVDEGPAVLVKDFKQFGIGALSLDDDPRNKQSESGVRQFLLKNIQQGNKRREPGNIFRNRRGT